MMQFIVTAHGAEGTEQDVAASLSELAQGLIESVDAAQVSVVPAPERSGLPSITHSDESIEGWLSKVDHLAKIGAVVELIGYRVPAAQELGTVPLGDFVIVAVSRRESDGVPYLVVDRWRDFAPNVPGDRLVLDLDDISDIRIY